LLRAAKNPSFGATCFRCSFMNLWHNIHPVSMLLIENCKLVQELKHTTEAFSFHLLDVTRTATTIVDTNMWQWSLQDT
jgi:hypothetical protein